MATILSINPGQDVGGAEVYLSNLLRHLLRRHALSLLVHPAAGLVDYFRCELPEVLLTTAPMTYAGLPELLSQASQIICRQHVELVHLNGRRVVVLAPALKLCFPRVKILTTFHSNYFNRDEPLAKALSLWLLHFLPLHCCDGVIAVSKQVYRERRGQLLPEKKLHLIKNGIDLERFMLPENVRAQYREETRKSLGLNDAIVVGEVGRLVPGKGQHFLLEALARCRQNGQNFKALLVGDGPSREELENLSRRLQIETAVIFAGHQPDTRPFLAAMDLFALPSLNEGLPLSLLEAMAMGLPIIATRSGGIPELIVDGKTGLLAPPNDVHALAQRLGLLVENVALQQQLVRQARELVCAEFDQKKMLARHETVFEALL